MTAILRFLKQPSTWRGITWALTLLGVSLSPEQAEAIALAGVAVVAVLEVFSDEDKRPRDINISLPPVDLQGKSESTFDDRGFNKSPDPRGMRNVQWVRDGVSPVADAKSDMDKQRDAGFNNQ